ncbi:MAG: hypothetical protein KY469_20270 [Actinobacteria bacterium]|nr:hypothetical protein [Actinomycetota bacterium]
MRIRTAAIAVTAAIVASLPTAALASAERMQLTCYSGSLAGHTLERANGSNWWDVDDGTVYTTTSLEVSNEDGVVHSQRYGAKAATPETCTGTHFDFTWDVELVASAPR